MASAVVAEAIPASRVLAQSVAAQTPQLPEHGRHIFVYGHFRTNQVIYSLTRVMQNNRALKQLPFLGKKTKPPALRKDHWRPLATLTFPTGRQGLNAYKELREFRVRHEHEWHFPDLVRASKAKVARRLQDQKANSIADMAYVLIRQDRVARFQAKRDENLLAKRTDAETKAQERLVALRKLKAEAQTDTTPEGIQNFKQLKAEKQRLVRNLAKPVEERDFPGLWKPAADARPTRKRGMRRVRGVAGAPKMSMDGVRIEWANILDAEFAASWPKAVIHDSLDRGGPRTRNIPSTADEVVVRAEDETPVDVPQPTKAATEVGSDKTSGLRKLIDRLRFGRQDALSV